MKILIVNIHSPKNLGDRAIIQGMTDLLRKKYPDARFYYMSNYFQELRKIFSGNAIKNLIFIPPDKNFLIRAVSPVVDLIKALFFIILFYLKLDFIFKSLNANNPVRILYESDLILSAGGNYLFSSNKSFFSRTMYVSLLHMVIAKMFKKPTILFPQSVGPFHRSHDRFIVSTLLKLIDYTLVRDKDSFALLTKENFPKDNLHLVPDIAFYNSIKRNNSSNGHQVKNVLLTAVQWNWALSPDKKKNGDLLFKQYKNNLLEIIRYLNSKGINVNLFVQSGAEVESDLHILTELKKESSNRNVTLIDISDNSLNEVYNYYEKNDIIIGTRMHSCIFGIMIGLPTIGLAYQPKTFGTFNLLEIDDYAFDAINLDSYAVIKKLDEIINDYSNKKNKFGLIADDIRSQIENLMLSKI